MTSYETHCNLVLDTLNNVQWRLKRKPPFDAFFIDFVADLPKTSDVWRINAAANFRANPVEGHNGKQLRIQSGSTFDRANLEYKEDTVRSHAQHAICSLFTHELDESLAFYSEHGLRRLSDPHDPLFWKKINDLKVLGTLRKAPSLDEAGTTLHSAVRDLHVRGTLGKVFRPHVVTIGQAVSIGIADGLGEVFAKDVVDPTHELARADVALYAKVLLRDMLVVAFIRMVSRVLDHYCVSFEGAVFSSPQDSSSPHLKTRRR